MTEEEARKEIGVDANATLDDVKKKFRREALERHPDTNFVDTKEIATEKMQRLNEAKATLDKVYESTEVKKSPSQETNSNTSQEEERRRRSEQQREWERIKNQERNQQEARYQSAQEKVRMNQDKREEEKAEW